MITRPPLKWLQCAACAQWLPARPEFFARRPRSSKMRWVCLECGGVQDVPPPPPAPAPADATERVCTHCGESWPATPEFFRPLPGGRYLPLCLACETDRRNAWRARAAGAPAPGWHMSDAIAQLLTGAHFFHGAQIGRVARFAAQP